MDKLVAIHQPNFFPWLGYFQKIKKSNFFVFMDDVAYPKSGNSMGCWCNRVKILIQNQDSWINAAVIREHGEQLIKNVKIDNNVKWREKIIKTIEINYKKAPKFSGNWDWIRDLINYNAKTIAEYNMHAIKEIVKKIGINANFIVQSDLNTKESSTELLIEIVKKVNGEVYLCGGGAKGYQEDEKFDEYGIKLVYQNFLHPQYKQTLKEGFIPGLSIIDILLTIGIEKTRELVIDE